MTAPPIPPDLVLTPVSRWPTKLPDATVAVTLAMADETPEAEAPGRRLRGTPRVSIVVVTSNNLPFLALSLRSVLVNTDAADYELVVVVSGSKDGSAAHVRKLMKAHRHVRAVFNDTNRSFAAANNQGVAATTGALLVLLNDDTVVPAGWL